MEPRPASPASPFPLTRVSGTQAIHRAIKVLRCIARSRNDGVGLSVICKQTGLIKSTVHRLTNDLISEGLVQKDAQTRRYVLGAECHELRQGRPRRFGRLQNAA